jgi:Outer membrane protein beta-barrel domain
MFLKRFVFLLAASVSASMLHAQAIPTATRSSGIQVGATYSIISTDYSGYVQGISIYGDVDLTRHIGVEALWRDGNIISPHDIGEQSYLIGPRFYMHKKRFAPYGKFLFGRGVLDHDQGDNPVAFSNAYWIYAIGGGVDYNWTRRVNVRVFDFEYQRWPNFPPNALSPLTYSFGAAYRF